MTPDDRRRTLVEATIPLLHEHGKAVTTKQIADAAGVAEGTLFRVFDSKDDLVTAAVGFRSQITDSIQTGVAYEIPLTSEENSVIESRLTLDLVWRF